MSAPVVAAPEMERARGRVGLAVARRDGRNAVADLAQAGCGRLLFPVVAAGAALEAVVVNTSGGLTGGDRFAAAVEVRPGAAVVATTQACEKIYRSTGETAEVETRLTLGAGARLAWLPQETILFDRARLARRLEVAMDEDASLLAVEAVLLGRKASGESLTAGAFHDSWRIRRGGRLVLAEETGFAGDVAATLAAGATLAGAAAYATVVLVDPAAEARLAVARDLLTNEAIEGGISSFDGLCVARLVAQDGGALRAGLIPLLRALGGEVPRVWSL
ncbi:urease accessory protein [Labrys wisconsinensis]|uniref:Urease accessory protein UreD n=2 Tax=Labrys wisconsinensis TaxID=425677 RepID=A0ABU0IZY2_9HYPH|nr:urease accessory protein UreD [Labrys wisconsinensis]MDQ0467577.1 urease accessory protein [Labrys wisconsinensis]